MSALPQSKTVRLVLICAVLWPFGLSATAQDSGWKPLTPDVKLKPGDKVRVHHMNWIEGTVVAVDHSGWPEVKFVEPHINREITMPFPPDHVQVRAKKPRRTKPRARPGKSGNPFEPADNFRKWADETGQFEIEAELVEATETDAVLKKRDGSEIAVPIDRLSEKDREYLASLEAEAGDSENPYAGESGIIEPDRSSAEGLVLQAVEPENPEPDGGAGAAPPAKRSLTLPGEGSHFERISGVFPATGETGLVAIGVYADFDEPTYGRVYLCDLNGSSRKVTQFEIPDKSVPLDIGPHGKLLITRSAGRMHGEQTRMALWKLEGDQCVKQWDCYPYAGGRHQFDSGVHWAKFIDEEHLLTYGGGGWLALWRLPEMKAIYAVSLRSDPHSGFLEGSSLTLSPGKKYLAFLADGAIYVMDVMKGEMVGTYYGAGKSGDIVFRPDGKRIALTTATRVQVWEFATGEMYRDIGFSAQYNQLDEAVWPAPGYILVGGRYLIDLEHHSFLWEYRPASGGGSNGTAYVIGRRLWFLAGGAGQRTLLPFSVPHEAVGKKVAGIRPQDTLILQPGMEVSLDVQVSGTPAEQTKIREAYEKNLRDNGFTLVDSAPVKVVARTERGEIEKLAYRDWGASPFHPDEKNTHRATFQGHISRVTLSINGKVAWEMTSVKRAPHHLTIRGGESVDQALRRHEKVNLAFFDGVVLPRYLCVPVDTYTFGATEVTSGGPRPAEPTPRKKPEKRAPAVRGNRA